MILQVLEQQIEDLEQHFQNAAESYSANTKDKVCKPETRNPKPETLEGQGL